MPHPPQVQHTAWMNHARDSVTRAPSVRVGQTFHQLPISTWLGGRWFTELERRRGTRAWTSHGEKSARGANCRPSRIDCWGSRWSAGSWSAMQMISTMNELPVLDAPISWLGLGACTTWIMHPMPERSPLLVLGHVMQRWTRWEHLVPAGFGLAAAERVVSIFQLGSC